VDPDVQAGWGHREKRLPFRLMARAPNQLFDEHQYCQKDSVRFSNVAVGGPPVRQHPASTAAVDSSVGLNQSVLYEFDGRDRPLSIVSPDRDSQTVQFVKPNVLHRSGLAVSENHGLADELRLGLLECAENHRRTELYRWHGFLRNRADLASLRSIRSVSQLHFKAIVKA
jgi:hypothetical protein